MSELILDLNILLDEDCLSKQSQKLLLNKIKEHGFKYFWKKNKPIKDRVHFKFEIIHKGSPKNRIWIQSHIYTKQPDGFFILRKKINLKSTFELIKTEAFKRIMILMILKKHNKLQRADWQLITSTDVFISTRKSQISNRQTPSKFFLNLYQLNLNQLFQKFIEEFPDGY